MLLFILKIVYRNLFKSIKITEKNNDVMNNKEKTFLQGLQIRLLDEGAVVSVVTISNTNSCLGDINGRGWHGKCSLS